MTLLFCLTGTQIGCKEKEKQFQNLDFSNHVLVSWLFLAYRRLTFSTISVTILTKMILTIIFHLSICDHWIDCGTLKQKLKTSQTELKCTNIKHKGRMLKVTALLYVNQTFIRASSK